MGIHPILFNIMYMLITYDVNTETNTGKNRLRKVAKLCEKYGHRVQNSVFECSINSQELLLLKDSLSNIIDKGNDSIRFYRLPKNFTTAISYLGVDNSIHLEEPTVI